MKNNRICQILNIEKPVIQGPLSWLTDARLVAAVSNAGGLGVLGPNAGLTAETAVSTPEETAEKMREEIRKTKRLTEKPFGVNLIPTPENDIWTPPILQVIKEEGVRAVVYTGYGEGALIPALFNELKEAVLLLFTVISIRRLKIPALLKPLAPISSSRPALMKEGHCRAPRWEPFQLCR